MYAVVRALKAIFNTGIVNTSIISKQLIKCTLESWTNLYK